MKKIVPLTVLVLVVLGFPVVARAGVDLVPDRSFGEGGFQRMELGGVATPEVKVDRVGKALVGDIYGFVRLRRDGRVDPGFGGRYGVTLPDRISVLSTYATSDIKLGKRGMYAANVTRGSSGMGFSVVLLNQDGRRVKSFGRNGFVNQFAGDRHTFTATALSVRRDNRIYVAGGIDRNSPRRKAGRLVRYLPDGRVDRSFARNGVFRMRPAVGKRGVPSRSQSGVAEFTDVLPAGDGGVFVSGLLESRFVMLKVRANGSLDRRFGGGDGKVSIRTVRSDNITMAGSWYMDGKISRSADGRRFLAVVQAPHAKRLRWRLVQISRKGRVLRKRTTALPGRIFTSTGERRHFYPSAVMASRGGEVVVTGSAEGSDGDGRSISDPVLMMIRRNGGFVRSFGKRGISILESAPLWDITDADYQPGFGVTIVGAESKPWFGSPRAEVARFKLMDKSNDSG